MEGEELEVMFKHLPVITELAQQSQGGNPTLFLQISVKKFKSVFKCYVTMLNSLFNCVPSYSPPPV